MCLSHVPSIYRQIFIQTQTHTGLDVYEKYITPIHEKLKQSESIIISRNNELGYDKQ